MSRVTITETKIILPTYELGMDYKEPAFCEYGAGNWSIYPYTFQENLTGKRKEVSYRALVLENKYLRISVLPELGGRVRSVFDKIKNREIFYDPGVIKPGLLALRGAWICGGIEFNSTHPGHSVTTISPVLCRKEYGRSRASITVGDIEQNYGTEWSVRITLYRDKPFFETEINLHNPNPYPVPCYFWTNTALPFSDSLQVFFPSTRIKILSRIHNYPIHGGIDMSWIRNYLTPSDIFAHNIERDWFVVYDHLSQAGLVHIADRRKCRGRKIFTFGRADESRMWPELLSDNHTTYIEMQSGMLETQSETGLILPGRKICWKERWYPFHSAPRKVIREALDYYIKHKKLSRKSIFTPGPDTSAKTGKETEKDLLSKGIEEYKFGNNGNALKFFEMAGEKNPDSAKPFIWSGIIYYRMGFIQKAKGMFGRALKKEPGNKEALHYLKIPGKNQQKNKIEFLWDRTGGLCISDFSASSNFYLELALRRMNCGKYREAEDILLEYLHRNRGNVNPMVYYYLGFCTQDLCMALKYYNLAGKLSQDYVFPHRTEEIEILKKVLEYNPCDCKVRYYLGNLLYYKGRTDEAIKEWIKSVEMGNNYPVLYRNLGFAYWKVKNELRLAQKYYEKAISLDPYSVKAYLELCEVYRQSKDYNKAFRMFRNMPEEMRNNEHLIKQLAALYITTNQPQKAIDLLSKKKFQFIREGERTVTHLLQRAQFSRLLMESK